MAAEHTVHETEIIHEGDSVWSGGKAPFKASYGKLMMWYFLLSDAFTFAGFLIAYGTLRFSSPTWPVPDFVFSTLPGGLHHKPLIFVTFMTFVLIVSSVTMVRAVQEGHRYNKKGVIFWMALTIVGGLSFLSCQAWEWTTLMGGEHMSIRKNPFGTHIEAGTYMEGDGHDIKVGDAFHAGQTYLIHKHENEWNPLTYKTEAGEIKEQQFGPKAFGALFFFITGFHGFHVFSGVIFLTIIMLNVASGLYNQRKNHYEMVEKIGLYWHFVDLVWVFVFLVFYLL
jgi:cytochrome c oxidase subunit 3